MNFWGVLGYSLNVLKVSIYVKICDFFLHVVVVVVVVCLTLAQTTSNICWNRNRCLLLQLVLRLVNMWVNEVSVLYLLETVTKTVVSLVTYRKGKISVFFFFFLWNKISLPCSLEFSSLSSPLFSQWRRKGKKERNFSCK